MDIKNLKVKDFTPLWDNIIVRPLKVTEKGNFVRPQNEEDKSELGEVLAIGRGVFGEGFHEKKYIEIGDVVLFNKYSSTTIDLSDDLIVRAEDVVAVAKHESLSD